MNPGFQTPIGGGFSAIMGVPYGQWITSGGKAGKEPFAEMKATQGLRDKGQAAATPDERIQIGKDLHKMVVDNVFSTGLVAAGLTQGGRVAQNPACNIPGRVFNTS